MVPRLSRSLGVLVVVLSLLLPAFTVTNAAAQAGFPLTANTAYCDPGYFGPFVDCTPWARVTVSFTAVDQDFATTCVTAPDERTASCTVEVPFGATIIAAIDPGIVPAGYVLEGPAALEFIIPDGPPEGAFGGPAFVLLPLLTVPPIEAPPVVEQPPVEGGFPLPANAASCTPGYLGPFVDCEPWSGLTVRFVTTDGTFATSCVTSGTGRAASCVVEVPFGATVVASIDPGVVPAGYVLEGPSSVQIVIPEGPPEGEFGGATFVLLPVPEGATVSPTEVAPTEVATVEAEAGGLPAGLYSGTCAELSAGEVKDPVATLTSPRLPTGTQVGAADAVQMATSYTVVPVPFPQLLDGAHVVAIFDEAVPEMVVACGILGGVPDDNGALSVGLEPMGGTGTEGVAYLSAGGNGASTVSLFIGDLKVAPVPGAAGASETFLMGGEWPSEPSEQSDIHVEYWGCPLGTDMSDSAETLKAVCREPVGGSNFWLQSVVGNVVMKSPPAPGGFGSGYLTPADYTLRMWPVPKGGAAVFCGSHTLYQDLIKPYTRMEVVPYVSYVDPGPSEPAPKEGIAFSLAEGELFRCDWFVVAPDIGVVSATPLLCPPGLAAIMDSIPDGVTTLFYQLTKVCSDPVWLPTHELTTGGAGSTAKLWNNQVTIFDNVTPGTVTITETVPPGYEVSLVICRNQLVGYSTGWSDGPYYQATITGGNAVTGSVDAGWALNCWFFHTPTASSAIPGSAMAAVLVPGMETRLRRPARR
jgi:hypothetical protein